MSFFKGLFLVYSYEMMLQCWSENAESRPSFSQLTSHLDDMLSSETRKVPWK